MLIPVPVFLLTLALVAVVPDLAWALHHIRRFLLPTKEVT